MINISYVIYGREINEIPNNLSVNDWSNIIIKSNNYYDFMILKRRIIRINIIKKLL